MIVYSKKQYLVSIPNTLVLQKDDNFFYVEKSLYDSTVILNHVYEMDRIKELIGLENNVETSEWLEKELPSPINALAPFLRLVSKEIPMELEICIGSLHELFCTGLNPYGFLKVPSEVRRSVEFGRTGHLYKEMWDCIMNQYIEKDVVEKAIKESAFGYVKEQSTAVYVDSNSEVSQEVKEFEDAGDGYFYFEDEESDEIEPLNLEVKDVVQTQEEDETVIEIEDEDSELQRLKAALKIGG